MTKSKGSTALTYQEAKTQAEYFHGWLNFLECELEACERLGYRDRARAVMTLKSAVNDLLLDAAIEVYDIEVGNI